MLLEDYQCDCHSSLIQNTLELAGFYKGRVEKPEYEGYNTGQYNMNGDHLENKMRGIQE